MKRPHFINKFSKALPADICEEAIERFEEKIDQAEKVQDEFRDDYSLFIDNYQSFDRVQEAINLCLHTYYKDITEFQDNSLDYSMVIARPFKLQKSLAGGGFTDWHTEQGSSQGSKDRFAVWMIYLNTVNKGGKTEFLYYDKAVKPEQGTLLIWPASYTHVHRAAPDLEETKYIATGWFTYGNGSKHHRLSSENNR